MNITGAIGGVLWIVRTVSLWREIYKEHAREDPLAVWAFYILAFVDALIPKGNLP